MNGVGEMCSGDYKDNTIDAFGDAYEYLMSMYASNAGKSGGEFYTPADDMAEVITFADSLRAQGHWVNLVSMKKKFGKQLSHYEEKGYAGFLVYGRDEGIKTF